MSELQRLREAMRVTERPSSLDLAAIMRDGRRLRRRRVFARSGGATLAAAFVAAVAVVAVNQDDPSLNEHVPTPAAVAPTPSPAFESESRKPIGAVVDTGISYGVERRVYYFVPVEVPGHPKVRMGLVGGRLLPGGSLTSDYLVNDVEGIDRSAGFHEIGNDESGPGQTRPPVPTFGYFVGPAQSIVGTVDGKDIKARLARWSEDAQVVIFWFDPTDLAPGVPLDGIIARDKSNRRL
ncbi:hypothetical protein SAMN05421812_102705 [Asanoa hainanensis]|uniref:Uncharacterized protein n=1 Tax=Asanoa hainanensis TaxID=560556 RepID=A0A239J3J1_9ACTN|nr:hypothetical protein [Asanoa hainanensis]SNT00375.1 hypothetical protein SAMN05421812_102705 [Asanoa hainanensis]